MELFDVIKKRYSARSYKADQVEQEKLDMILEAARLAPTAANRQAFKILVIKTEGRREGLKKIYKHDWFADAPVVIAVCAIPEKNWIRRDSKNYSDVDAAIVMDHIILAATALGLGTCWIGALDLQAAREILELGENIEPVAFTPLGYANETTVNKIRKDLKELAVYQS